MEYRRHDGGYEEVYTYADHLADFGVPLRGQVDIVMGSSFWRVRWRKAKRLKRIGWKVAPEPPTIAWYREAKSPEEMIDFLAGNRRK